LLPSALMLRAIVRPEKSAPVMQALLDAGYPAVTKLEVAGRGKQRGLKVGDVTYDELPKEMVMAVVHGTDKDLLIKAVMGAARTGEKGAYGDGKIFVLPGGGGLHHLHRREGRVGP